MKYEYNFHTHTKRCGHAYGEDEEYVLNAIEAGFKVLGFSDHVPLPGISQKRIRADYEELDGYVHSINELKKKYKDKITIYCGFECEYFENYESYYKYLLESKTVDYLILGQHFYFAEDGVMKSCTFSVTDFLLAQEKYLELLIKGMRSHLFKYVCHPDIYSMLEDHWTSKFEEMAEEICRVAKEENIPLEINLCRTDDREFGSWLYPNENFWKIAGKYQNRVIIGIDAHSPERFFNERIDYAFYLIEKYNLNYEENYSIE